MVALLIVGNYCLCIRSRAHRMGKSKKLAHLLGVLGLGRRRYGMEAAHYSISISVRLRFQLFVGKRRSVHLAPHIPYICKHERYEYRNTAHNAQRELRRGAVCNCQRRCRIGCRRQIGSRAIACYKEKHDYDTDGTETGIPYARTPTAVECRTEYDIDNRLCR